MKRSKQNKTRLAFAHALSAMYQSEVPLYAQLVSLVNGVNQNQSSHQKINQPKQERHGAIRLGKASELFQIRRLFALMGMYPVAYYDLSTAGLPVHSTAFRPINTLDLEVNPLRIFTSLLRLELISDQALRHKAQSILNERHLFNAELLDLIELGENTESFNEQQSQRFIALALDLFKWHNNASVDHKTYQELKTSHPLIADIVSFQGPHINHLTPATLDIDRIQQVMIDQNIKAKAHIEGPPKRLCSILLRQTSFTAIAEKITFKGKNGHCKHGVHTARFGEIEQRGVALTPKGQQLYERLIKNADKKSLDYENELVHVFLEFPDDFNVLRTEKLAYFTYSINHSKVAENIENSTLKNKGIELLIECGAVSIKPIIYEDFLPVSAAGIFTSNLETSNSTMTPSQGNKALFEAHMGCDIIDPFSLYEAQEKASIEHCLAHFS